MGSSMITDSVIFFDDNIVVKEMLYIEFEAILDHVVGIQEFSDKEISAVFVQINSHLQIVGTVFFLIKFDSDGYADKAWNIPLKHLADHAGRGPNLGAGPIKLSCRSQCSVSWHQRSLWDPNMESNSKTFDQLCTVVKRNRLGIIFEPEFLTPPESLKKSSQHNDQALSKKSEKELTEKLQRSFQKELKSRLTAQSEEYKLRIAAMKSEAHDHVEKLHASYREQLNKSVETLQASKQMFIDEKHKNQKLKKTLDTQVEKFHKDRENFQKNIISEKRINNSDLTALQEKFDLELKISIDRATAELKERLDMREVELFYRDEQIGRLHEDIIALRKEKQQLIDSGGSGKVLNKLAETGITFVAYHPGVDHLTISIRDMAEYLESPTKYVAEKCGVDLESYKQWLSHYELPVCNYKLEDGSICANPIQKVDKPSHFIVGKSDCCSRHSENTDILADVLSLREAT